jgi:hypoxanthine phosphoribosyltransferase
MSREYRQDMDKIYIGYDEVHETTKSLFNKLKKGLTPHKVVLIAVARGGWATSRLLAASFEEEGVENRTYSINAGYQLHGTPDEYVALTQALDDTSIEAISQLVKQGAPLIIADSVCQTGRELLVIKQYLQSLFPNAKIYVGVMNWVKYRQSLRTPWRSAKLDPDFYGSVIESEQMPYVEYPWEYSSLEQFNKVGAGK